ncbi:MAG: hypothetical protein ACTSPB_10355 [Candidatus Thorarchaeota archaeon]
MKTTLFARMKIAGESRHFWNQLIDLMNGEERPIRDRREWDPHLCTPEKELKLSGFYDWWFFPDHLMNLILSMQKQNKYKTIQLPPVLVSLSKDDEQLAVVEIANFKLPVHKGGFFAPEFKKGKGVSSVFVELVGLESTDGMIDARKVKAKEDHRYLGILKFVLYYKDENPEAVVLCNTKTGAIYVKVNNETYNLRGLPKALQTLRRLNPERWEKIVGSKHVTE